MLRVVAVLIFAISFSVASAQPPSFEPPAESRAVEFGDGKVAVLIVDRATPARPAAARVEIDGRVRDLEVGADVTGTVLATSGGFLLAYASVRTEHPFAVRIGSEADLAAEIPVQRPATPRGYPYGVAAARTPTGFAVFFQELDSTDPSLVHTYLAVLGSDGRPRGPATEIQVPWGIVDAAWNGHGYHLALIYPNDANGLRLSMVSTTPEGVPEQHPDWASAAGLVQDVHLDASGGRVRAFFRGGARGDRVYEADVTQIRDWGSEPPPARDHGAIGPADRILAPASGSSGMSIHRRANENRR